jgi:hypothetical protein
MRQKFATAQAVATYGRDVSVGQVVTQLWRLELSLIQNYWRPKPSLINGACFDRCWVLATLAATKSVLPISDGLSRHYTYLRAFSSRPLAASWPPQNPLIATALGCLWGLLAVANKLFSCSVSSTSRYHLHTFF